MQRTADRLTITVGDSKYPIALTDSAVEAVQEEAAGVAAHALAELPDCSIGGDLLDMDLSALIDARQTLAALTEAIDVLIECRPLDELDTDD